MIFDILFIVAILATFIVQAIVHSKYKKYAKVENMLGLTGEEVAKQILESRGISGINIVPIEGELTDCYDPRKKELRLSRGVFEGKSLSSLGIAAHEVGHACQDAENYGMLKLRNATAGGIMFADKLVIGVIILNLICAFVLSVDISGISLLLVLGYLFFLLFFQLITLPVEFDASKRAETMLYNCGFVVESERNKIKDLLFEEAITYVAATAVTLMNILRLLRRR